MLAKQWKISRAIAITTPIVADELGGTFTAKKQRNYFYGKGSSYCDSGSITFLSILHTVERWTIKAQRCSLWRKNLQIYILTTVYFRTSEAAVTDWHDGVQVSWAHLSPACCAFLQGFGSKMLHSLLWGGPRMRAICRCFQRNARLTTFISHSSVNSAGTRTNNCASKEEKLHLVPVWECLTFLHKCEVSTERICEQTRVAQNYVWGFYLLFSLILCSKTDLKGQ